MERSAAQQQQRRLEPGMRHGRWKSSAAGNWAGSRAVAAAMQSVRGEAGTDVCLPACPPHPPALLQRVLRRLTAWPPAPWPACCALWCLARCVSALVREGTELGSSLGLGCTKQSQDVLSGSETRRRSDGKCRS